MSKESMDANSLLCHHIFYQAAKYVDSEEDEAGSIMNLPFISRASRKM
jgi:hypothetical protein